MELARSMLCEKEVPKEFWPEAVNWAVYVMNRSPSAAVTDRTPEEAWSSRKPSVDYFKVFGCVGYVHNPDQRRKNLDDKSTKCIHLGISNGSKAWRLYNPATKRVMVSRDVVFAENESWNWTSKESKDQERTLEWGDEGENEVDDAVDERGESFEEAEDNTTNTKDATERVHTDDVNERNTTEDVVEGYETGYDEADLTTQRTIVAAGTSQPQGRTVKKPAWMTDHVSGEGLSEDDEVQNLVLYTETGDPSTYEEAVLCSKWREAMECEIKSIEKNRTWKMVTLPKGVRAIDVKWLYKTKLNEKGEVDKYKAKLVALGYAQKHGIDYTEVFAPVARWDTIRIILAMAATHDWQVF